MIVVFHSNTAVSIPVLPNDTDDGFPGPLSIVSASQPQSGSATIQGSSILYTPANGFLGNDQFIYTITDGEDTSTATVRVSVFFSDGDRWYPFNQTEGTITYEAGGGSPATLRNFSNPAAAWVAGRFGRGLSFDNVDDSVSIDGFPGIQGTAARTCAAWIKTTASGGNKPFIAWGPNSAGAKWTFLMNTVGQIRLEIGTGFVVGTTAVNNGQWHHVACTFANDGSPNATDIKLYVNGVLEAVSSSSSFALNTGDAGDVRIGSDIQNRFWNGEIDEVRILPRALAPSEIATIAQSSPAQDPSAAAWWKRHFGNAAINWNADADNDRFSNFAEYAFGGRPNLPDASSVFSSGGISDGAFRLEHLRLKSGTSALTYQLRHSGELESWQNHPATPSSVLPATDPAYERVIYQITPGPGAEFFHLRAQQP
ncbi:MAG: Ig-like domain-containing protein [Akkermansiaceae bacterium]|nr:Ig-like domain-containing protein [Akkermansiaceae bacterium]